MRIVKGSWARVYDSYFKKIEVAQAKENLMENLEAMLGGGGSIDANIDFGSHGGSTYSFGEYSYSSFSLDIFKVSDKGGKELGILYAYSKMVDPNDYANEGATPSDQLGGMQVMFGYISCGTGGPETKDLNWIQRVKTNSIINFAKGQVANKWFTDQTDDARRAGVPYYTTNEYLQDRMERGKDIDDPSGFGRYTTIFNDRPVRWVADAGSNYLNINWTANLTLVDIRANSPLITISYGFTINQGVVTLLPITVIGSSQ